MTRTHERLQQADGAMNPLRLGPLPELPLVSILMPNYNYEDMIAVAIESVLAQTYNHFELIVVDDCSTDGSVDVIERYMARDERIRLVRHEHNQGHQGVLSTGFAASRGEIICLLDSDDIFLPKKVELVVKRFQARPNAGFMVNRAMVVDKWGNDVQVVPLLGQLQEGWIARYLIERGGYWRDMSTSALSFRREPAELAFPIPPTGLRAAGDSYCFTLMPLLTEVTGIDQVLSHWRIHGGNGYGTFGFTIDLIDGDLLYLERNWKAINQRLIDLGYPERQLDLNRHLHQHRRLFERKLLLNENRLRLLVALCRITPMIMKYDLSGSAGKAVRLVAYAGAIPMPMTLRHRWLALVLGKNRARNWASSMIRRMSQLTSTMSSYLRSGRQQATPLTRPSGDVDAR